MDSSSGGVGRRVMRDAAMRVPMPLFPLLLQSTDRKMPPARAAVGAVVFVLGSALFVGDAAASILSTFF